MPDSVRGPYTEQFHPPYRTGIVAQIESVPPYRVRVQFPDQANVLSFWLPVQVMKTMNDKDFWQPDIGEQVSVVMDEWDENGIVTGGVPSTVDSATSRTHAGRSLHAILRWNDHPLQHEYAPAPGNTRGRWADGSEPTIRRKN